MIDRVFPKLHNEGYKFLVIFGIITVILYFISSFLGLLGLVLTVWCYYFFRDPERQSINDDNYLVSPADGEVIKIEEVNGPKELNLESIYCIYETHSFASCLFCDNEKLFERREMK